MENNQLTFNSMLITTGGRYYARVESVFDKNRLFACKSVTSRELWSLVTGQFLSTNRVCWQHILAGSLLPGCKIQ